MTKSNPSSSEPIGEEGKCALQGCYQWLSENAATAVTGLHGNRYCSAYHADLDRRLVAPSSPDPVVQETGVVMIAAERRRQVEQEGWSRDHDAEHANGELALAAACYASPVPIRAEGQVPCGCRSVGECQHIFGATGWRDPWPWDAEFDKRGKHDRVRQLVIAGALIAAEIDRLSPAPIAEETKPDGETGKVERCPYNTDYDSIVKCSNQLPCPDHPSPETKPIAGPDAPKKCAPAHHVLGVVENGLEYCECRALATPVRQHLEGSGDLMSAETKPVPEEPDEFVKLASEHERILAALKDPVTVHVNILRGTIALTREQALHIAGATDYDTLLAIITRLRSEREEIGRIAIPYATDEPTDFAAVTDMRRIAEIVRGKGRG